MSSPPRLRQAVIAAHDLEAASGRLREAFGFGRPYHDEGVGYFGLRNAVFTLGDTFFEVVSPARPDTAAGRLLERRGGDCGYMLMFQVEDLAAARERARDLGVREVFAVELDDIAEVHLHPADMQGAIVSLSAPRPAGAWRWGGPGWPERAAALRVTGARVGVPDPEAVAERWTTILGGLPGVRIEAGEGLAEIELESLGGGAPAAVEFDRVRVRVVGNHEEDR